MIEKRIADGFVEFRSLDLVLNKLLLFEGSKKWRKGKHLK